MNLAIAGFGLIGKKHAKAIEQCEGAQLIAIADPNPATKSYAKKYDVVWYNNLESLLKRKVNLDGIILSTPTSLHLEQGLLCISHSCPILVEKPITVTVKEGETLTKAASEAGIPILVGHHRRHNPVIQRAKAIIDSGKIGKVRAVQAQCWFYKPDSYFDKAPWRKKKGAGPVSVNLVHDVDNLRYLCGEVNRVEALIHDSIRGFENEDTAGILFSFDSGAIGTMTLSDSIVAPWSWEFTARENPDYPATQQSCYHIGGSDGSLSIPDLTVWHYRSGQDEKNWWKPLQTEISPCDQFDPLIKQIKHFCDVIEGDKPIVSGEEGVKTLEIIEKVKNFQKN